MPVTSLDILLHTARRCRQYVGHALASIKLTNANQLFISAATAREAMPPSQRYAKSSKQQLLKQRPSMLASSRNRRPRRPSIPTS